MGHPAGGQSREYYAVPHRVSAARLNRLIARRISNLYLNRNIVDFTAKCGTPLADGRVSEWAREVSTAVRRKRRSHVSRPGSDRKSTRLNSSHRCISYAVF